MKESNISKIEKGVWFRCEAEREGYWTGNGWDDYEYKTFVHTHTSVRFNEYHIIKKTEKGVWLDGKRWVSNTARKRFAYPTKKEALEAFIYRKEKYQRILNSKLKTTEQAIEEAKKQIKRV